MALETKCKFYYGIEIVTDNNTLDFDDGTGEISVVIPVGVYSPQEIALKIASLMTNAGSQTYSVTFNRSTRKLTIGASSNFEILIASGTHSATILYQTLGYTGGSDLTGASSYLAPSQCGYEFVPQFYLLDYVPVEHNVRSVQASINETATGSVEVVRYGTKRFMECSMDLITNKKILDTTYWTYNPTGIEDALLFLNFATQKSKVEFMPDENKVNEYITLILESTEEDQTGIGFKLKEMLDLGTGFYRTGKLIFREIT